MILVMNLNSLCLLLETGFSRLSRLSRFYYSAVMHIAKFMIYFFMQSYNRYNKSTTAKSIMSPFLFPGGKSACSQLTRQATGEGTPSFRILTLIKFGV